jgi:2-phospho-L-lactate guanylyltransferase
MCAALPSSWCLVVPVKRLALAKSRLAGIAGPHRAGLALAFAADTVTAALASRAVAAVYVVTSDSAAASVLGDIGAVVVADEPDAGLNPALAYGGRLAAQHHPGLGIAALSGDLPALRPAELSHALGLASRSASAVVADAAGSGTTLYAASRVAAFSPAYGPDSLRRHIAGGAHLLGGPGLDSLRRDVDTPADLADALRMGVGPHTTAVAGQLAKR